MKLSVPSESNLSQGITSLVTTPKQPTPDPSSSFPSPATHLLSTGTQTDPASRQCPRILLYLFAVLLMLLLPLVLPLAITQAVRLLEAERLPQAIQHSLRGIMDRETGATDASVSHKQKSDWSRWAVVRNGRLYVSETFENRLNHYSELLYSRLGERFKHACSGGADVGFALNRGDGIRGWVEVTMKCGYGSCVRKAPVDDIRKLIVGVEDGKHYVTAGGQVWGPLRGPLKVGLDDDAVLGMRRMCDGVVDRVFVGVNELRGIVGDAVDVFWLDTGPRIQQQPSGRGQ